MKFIDMFSGIGGFRTAMENNGHECIAYSEIDKYAKQSYQAMYDTENEIDLGDITNISQEYLSHFKKDNDMVVGGSPCFRKGTLITTDNGLKPIEEIKKGDMVLTHNNRYKKVVILMANPAKEIYSLKVEKNVETFVTPEHPIRVREDKENEAKWVKVKDLDKNKHYVQLGNFEYSHIEELELLSTDETVYNFEVEDDNSYVANNMVVHNCQAFSIAGKQAGFEDTRGTLFFEYAKVVKETQPKYFLFENVKGMLSHDKGNTIRVVLETFNELGYYIDFNVFNSKYYGVPQNRERIYILGKRKDLVEQPKYHDKTKGKKKFDEIHNWAVDNINYVELLPPLQTEVTTRLIDVLENEVDEKYYLSEEKTKNLTLDNDLGGKLNMYDYNERDKVHSVNKVSPTLNTMQGGDRQPKVAVLGNTSNTGHRSQDIHDIDGICPTIAARDYKGAKQIAVCEVNQGVVIGGDFDGKEIERDTFEILQALQKEIGEKEIAEWRSRILDTFQQEEILRQDVYEKRLDIEQDEKKFERKEQSCECEVKNRTFDKQERMRKVPINKEFRCSSHGRGSIQQFARELTSVMQELSHETSQKKNLYRLRETTQCIRLLQQALYKIQEVWGSSLHEKQTIRIRKLVPIEIWRLQGFTDEQFYKAQNDGVSNSQLYKQAGNAVSVPVVDAIVKGLE